MNIKAGWFCSECNHNNQLSSNYCESCRYPWVNSREATKDFIEVKEKSRKCETQCPFCGEREFDMEGLKYHLEVHCEVFNNLNLDE